MVKSKSDTTLSHMQIWLVSLPRVISKEIVFHGPPELYQPLLIFNAVIPRRYIRINPSASRRLPVRSEHSIRL